ncbi:MAG: RimK family alpha-L-glutamate ligase [Desulfurococcales archaeon]|nr:RimK family alpha-L-glutamate ligase [Desulfurococcales archaeon]
MVRVAILHEAPVPTASVRQLLLAFMKRGVETLYLRLSRLSPFITKDGMWIGYGRAAIPRLDAAVVRGIGLVSSTEILFKRLDILRQLEFLGTLVVNPANSLISARDKFMALLKLREAGLPVPDTAVVEDVFEVSEITKRWGTVVLKPLMGSMGYGSIKVSDPDVAFMIAKTWITHGQPVYIQKYERKVNRDIRIFVVGDEALGAIYRYAPPDTWKTNVAQGARVERAPLDEELRELAIKASKTLGLLYSGIDVGETERGYVIYEVNSSPHWTGFMNATGINPAEKIASLVLNLVKR